MHPQALTRRFNFNITYDILFILLSVPLSSFTWTEMAMNKPHCCKLACLVVAHPLFWKLFVCPLSITPVVFSFIICILFGEIKYEVQFSPSLTSCWFIAVICMLSLISKRGYCRNHNCPQKTPHKSVKNLKSLVHVPACDTVISSQQLKPKAMNKSQMMRFMTSGAFPVSNPRRLEQGKAAVESWCLQSFPEAIQKDAVCQY